MALVTLTPSQDSTQDDQPRIQDAIDAVESDGGGEVFLTPGTYYVGAPDGGLANGGIRLGDDLHLRLHHDAVIVRRLNGPGDLNATIRNKEFTNEPPYTGNSNIRLSGGTIKTAAPDDPLVYIGTHLSFVNVRWLSIDNVRFTGVSKKWNTSFVDCTDVTVSNVLIDSGTELEEDGLHFAGGARIVVTNCDIRCGDDAIALVQAPPDTNNPPSRIWQQTELVDFVASNCYLHSRAANAFKARVVFDTVGSSVQPIRNVRISNIVAKTGGGATGTDFSSGIDLVDENNNERVSDVVIDNFMLDAVDNQLAGLLVDGVARVELSNITIANPFRAATIDRTNEMVLKNVTIRGPRDEEQPCLWVARQGTCSGIRIQGGGYVGANWHGIVLGIDDEDEWAVSGFQLCDALIAACANCGVFLWNARLGIVTGNTIQFCNLSGIEEVAPLSSRNLIIGNYLWQNGTPVTFTAANTEVVRNICDPGVKLADSGGFRQTIDGWESGDISGTVSETEMKRFGFLSVQRLRVARPGSITGLVINSGLGVTAGTITIRAYKNSTTAGNTGTIISGCNLTLTSAMSPTNAKRFQTFAQNQFTFGAGDELYLTVQSSGVTPSPLQIRSAIEIED